MPPRINRLFSLEVITVCFLFVLIRSSNFDAILFSNFGNSNFWISKMAKRVHLTLEKRLFIKFLRRENQLSPKQIRAHPELQKPDGSSYQLKVIRMWCDRVDQGESLEVKRGGGPLHFLEKEEDRKELTDFIENNSQMNYRQVKSFKGLACSRSTVNRYALKAGIRKLPFNRVFCCFLETKSWAPFFRCLSSG